jgi:hypothetical protein
MLDKYRQECPLCRLPNELLLIVVGHLYIEDISAWLQTSRLSPGGIAKVVHTDFEFGTLSTVTWHLVEEPCTVIL